MARPGSVSFQVPRQLLEDRWCREAPESRAGHLGQKGGGYIKPGRRRGALFWAQLPSTGNVRSISFWGLRTSALHPDQTKGEGPE